MRILVLAALCWWHGVAYAAAAGRDLKLAGYAPDLVRWVPRAEHSDYAALAPAAARITELKQLGYGSVAVGETHQLYLGRDRRIEETVSVAQLYLTAKGIESDGNNGFCWTPTTSAPKSKPPTWCNRTALSPTSTRARCNSTIRMSTTYSPTPCT